MKKAFLVRHGSGELKNVLSQAQEVRMRIHTFFLLMIE